jgi:hypothetical protein
VHGHKVEHRNEGEQIHKDEDGHEDEHENELEGDMRMYMRIVMEMRINMMKVRIDMKMGMGIDRKRDLKFIMTRAENTSTSSLAASAKL